MHVQPLLLTSVNRIGSPLRSGGSALSAVSPAVEQLSQNSQPEDELTLSSAALSAADEQASSEAAATELSPEEQKQVDQLQARDREVRQHEQAHLAAAGGFALGGPTYTYQQGPDGQQYAIGGEVQIDTSPVDGDPRATIQKARVIQAAAMAPAEPSSQDKAVAAAAAQMMQSAQQELRQGQADDKEADGELNGAKLLAEVDVNPPSPSRQSAASSRQSDSEAALQALVQNYFLEEAQAAYSSAASPSGGKLFLLA